MLLKTVIQELQCGNINAVTSEVVELMNTLALTCLSSTDPHKIDNMKDILDISNILYNNSDINLLPLDDGLYDILLEEYKKFVPEYQVGAIPVHFNETNNEQVKLQSIMRYVEKPETEDFLYADDILKEHKLTKIDLLRPIMFKSDNGLLSKRITNTKHVYPKLVGTLDKCKFVLNKQAVDKGVFEDNNVKVLERDFFNKHIQEGILNPARRFGMVLELKYDGISVEAEVSDEIISARTRGDANEDIAADLTPILEGYKFRYARNNVPKNEVFGMKFEAIMTYSDLQRYNQAKGRDYKNCRTAISGLFSSADAVNYKEFITLVPLATSIDDIDRLTEIEFMNKYYHSGEYLRYAYIEGNYLENLFQIKRFVEEAEYMRSFMPFMYDGVVVSYIDEDLINALGRVNSVNRYSTAIKFSPLKKLTTFRGYEFTVGQEGTITPMIHYDPIEFYGTIHTKSTGHSYERFKNLSLRLGDLLEVEYTNDVMPYVTKPDNSHNASNINPLCDFITHCPSCNSLLEESKSGKTIACNNIQCPERNLKRIVSMMDKLNLKDFSEAYMKQIGKYTLTDLLDTEIKDILFLGTVTSQKFIDRMNEIKTQPIYDYNIVGSLGFTNIGRRKWKLIFSQLTLKQILSMPDLEVFRREVVQIKGIGPSTADDIISEFEFFLDDLITIAKMDNVIDSKGVKSGKSIRFTGFRERTLLDTLNDMGHDASEGNITKTTDILLVPYEGFTSSKTKKVGPDTIIVSVSEFKENMDKYLK
ncbi:MAG: hypothetical protein ACRDD7_02195 [Peptostreptococcaceae bacterium]